MTDTQLQAQDEERAFFRCVELAEIAKHGGRFTETDVQDLIHFLGVKDYFKGDK